MYLIKSFTERSLIFNSSLISVSVYIVFNLKIEFTKLLKQYYIPKLLDVFYHMWNEKYSKSHLILS